MPQVIHQAFVILATDVSDGSVVYNSGIQSTAVRVTTYKPSRPVNVKILVLY